MLRKDVALDGDDGLYMTITASHYDGVVNQILAWNEELNTVPLPLTVDLSVKNRDQQNLLFKICVDALNVDISMKKFTEFLAIKAVKDMVGTCDKNGKTVLIVLCAKLLVKISSVVDMEVKISIFKLAFQIISMLIAAGADFNCVDKRGVSAGIYLFDAAALVKCGGATIFECIKYYGDKIDFTLPMFVASGKNFAVWLNGYIERCTNPQDAMYAGHEIAARIIYARLSLKTSRDKKITVCSRINQLKNKGVDLRKDVIAKEVKDMLFTPTNKYYIGDDCIAAFSRDAERCAVAATTPVPVVFSPLLLVSERGSTVRTPLEALSSGVPAVTAIFEGAQVDSIDCDRKVVKRSALEAFSADLSINTERKALCC